jgi:8-oxo-dGTP pyrophosphatase MutT (NUDIX family)
MNFKELWKGKYISVVSPTKYPYEAVHEKNGILCLPILNVNGRELFIIRKELCPPYTVYGGDQLFYTILSGQIDSGTSDATLVREIQEESGIVVKSYDTIWSKKNTPISKVTTAVGSLYIIRITKFEVSKPTGDGTAYEKASKALFVSEKQLGEIVKRPNVDFLLMGMYAIYKSVIGSNVQ